METSEAGYVNEHGQVNLGAVKRTGPFGFTTTAIDCIVSIVVRPMALTI